MIARVPQNRRARAHPAGRSIDRRAGLSAIAALLVFVFTILAPSGAVRAFVPKRDTVLTLQLSATALDLGVHPVAMVRLTSGGAPVRGELISVRIGSQVSKQVTTGSNGVATAEITRDLSAGRYQFVATFAGSTDYRSSTSATASLTVRPALLTITTVPAMPNLDLVRVGTGSLLKTGADGTLQISMADVGQVALKLALPSAGPARQVRLDRWDDGSTDLVRTIRIPDTLRVTVGLQILYPVKFTFSAANGASIASSGVPFVGISDAAGAEQTLSGPAPYWLLANGITRLTSGLDSAPVDYRVVSVAIDGAQVVNRGQQHFVVDEAKTVQVQLLVFDLDVQGRDALLKTGAGSRATITSTAGVLYYAELNAQGRATVRLPRGEYRILLQNGLGFPLSTPVALSRDQSVDVLFVTPLDVILVLGAALVAGFGLIVIGRPRLLLWRRRPPPGGPGGGADGPVGPENPGPPILQWPDPSAQLGPPRTEQRPRTGP